MLSVKQKLRERLAALAHKQWSGWIKYMFSKCVKSANGGLIIPRWAVDRWTRQSSTPYSRLSKAEKESDRDEADKFIEIINRIYDEKC